MVDKDDERKETPEDIEKQIQWWLSDEFEEHLDNCFGEAKREAIEERDAWLKANGGTQAMNGGGENSAELQALIHRFSQPEFADEITRLFGEAKDRAISERDALINKKHEHEQ